MIVAAALCAMFFAPAPEKSNTPVQLSISRTLAVSSVLLLLALLVVLPIVSQNSSNSSLMLFDSFYRIGASVFGGGHVVLPMLENEVVANGWVSLDDFLAGYGITQAMPGPIFTFAAFLGGVNQLDIPVLAGAGISLIAIFLPSFLLINCCFYFWQNIAANQAVQKALLGINASVVGFLVAAFYQPILTNAIDEYWQIVLVLVLAIVLQRKLFPAWLLVVASGLIAGLLL
mgnify:CR=1 FL=1